MKIKWNIFNRKTHYWGACVCAIPVLIVVVSGVFLLLKKESGWIQPPTMQGSGSVPLVTFEEILDISRTVEETSITSWQDIDRLDVRLDKGIIKIHAKNHWEIQVDYKTGNVLQVAYRRSDLIESIHDGSFFHSKVKLFIFLPSAIVLLTLWVTGIYLFVITLLAKNKKKRKIKAIKVAS